MKNLFGALAALLASAFMLASPAPAQQFVYTANAGVSLFTGQAATTTATSAAVRLPAFSGYGTATITEAGITGSPSGCTVVLAYEGNNTTTAGATQATITFTPSTGVQYFTIAPTNSTGDNYVATYACSSTYPTAGTITMSFSPGPPSTTVTGSGTFTTSPLNTVGTTDPCQNSSLAKSSVSIAITSATTTQLVALAAGKKVYVCDMTVTTVGTSASVALTSGTGSACGTVDAVLTGAMVPSATVGVIHLGYGGTVATTPTAGDELCLTSGATVTSVEGVLSYIQQ
jgi:hypothetical protein